MTQRTPLDEFVALVRAHLRVLGWNRGFMYAGSYIEASTRRIASKDPQLFSQALQDPRYLEYCREQETKEANHYCQTSRLSEVPGRRKEPPLDLRAINRRLSGRNDSLRGDTSSGPGTIMTKTRKMITV